MSIQIKKQMIK